jgi:DNA-binding MarR family transcriptional regulator
VQVSLTPSGAPATHTPPALATHTPPAPPADAEAAEIAGGLYAVISHLHKNCTPGLFEAVGALDLTLTQIKLLHHLHDAPDALTLKAAAGAVLVSMPAASRTVDDLVRRGLVERQEDPDDRRMKRIRIAADGRAVVRRLNAARVNGLEQFAATLTPAERLAVSGTIATLLERPEIAACRLDGNQAP